MRLVFLGTPEASVPSLVALVDAGHDVALVVTRPDTRRGRGAATSPSPVKAAAEALGLRVSHDQADVRSLGAQLGVVVAYGAMIPTATLDLVPMLNVHFSLLPRWRGAAPVERTILAGDVETGVCVMGLEESLDTGPVYARVSTRVDDKTASELTSELADLGARAVVEVLGRDELPTPVPQSGEATYAKKLTTNEFALDPSMGAIHCVRIVRVGRAFTWIADRRLRVRRAALSAEVVAAGHVDASAAGVLLGCDGGTVELLEVQPEGARAMDARAWWAGARLAPETTWGRVAVVGP